MAIQNSLVGRIFGSLLVLEDSGERNSKFEVIWKCECACGGRRLVRSSKLTSGQVTNCGCSRKITKKLPGTKKLRKKLREKLLVLNDPKITQRIKDNIVKDFMSGTSVSDLVLKYKVARTSLTVYLKNYRSTLNCAWELHTMLKVEKNQMTQTALDRTLVTKYVQPKLKALLSKGTSAILTEPELVYSWIYVNSGSNAIALKESGFEDVLEKTHQTSAYKQLLGIFLREKHNIAKYICDLQKEAIKNTDISKKYVQSELSTQVEQLREICSSEGSSSRNRGNMLKAIEMLGRSIGAFQDNIKITEADPNEALDTLIDLAKESVPVVNKGSYKVEEIE